MLDTAARLDALTAELADLGEVLIGCSGGGRSLLLATIAHRVLGSRASIVHVLRPGATPDDRARVERYAEREGWDLSIISGLELIGRKTGAAGLFDLLGAIGDAPICAAASLEALSAPGAPECISAARASGVALPFIDLDYGETALRGLAASIGEEALAEQL